MSLRFNWKVFVLVKLCIVFGSLIASFAVRRIGLGTEEDKRQNTEYDEIKITNEKASRRQYNKLAIKFIGRRLLEFPGDGKEPNCTMPAIVSFPHTLFTEAQREKGAIIIDFLVAIYLCVAISYVCFVYFVPSLEIISKMFGIQEDVAGATFMAIGSSAPEFFVSLVGSFVTHDSTGVSAIVGSSAFNVFVIIALCSLAAGRNGGLSLSWYPVIRDSICWFISLIILIVVTYDSFVQWWEGFIMSLSFAGYITIMYFNKQMSTFVLKWSAHCSSSQWAILSGKDEVETEDTAFIDDPSSLEMGSIGESGTSRQSYGTGYRKRDGTSSEDFRQEDSESEMPLPSVFKPPTSTVYCIAWLLGLPVIITLYCTVPDCRKAGVWRRCYPVTFVMSAVWLAGLSYVLYWMIVVIGYTLGVPDTVMGYTVLAIGTSLPDAVASVLVARDGFADMAVANIIGSNVFEIFICLGFVWFLKSVTSDPVSPVMISIQGLTSTTVSLLLTMSLLIVAIHFNKWKLDLKIGTMALLLYVIFIVWATLNAEGTFGEALSLFGQPNIPPPPCQLSDI